MPVLLKIKTYKWLQQIGVFRNEPIPSKVIQCCEVPYDEQIYLQNGYLIGVTLRKNVKAYSQSYKDLLKVRKIATLKSSQNWQIIEPYLRDIGIDSLTPYNQQNSDIEISTAIIAEILEELYDKYSPKLEQKIALAKKLRCNYVDFYNFDPDKPLQDADNSLEFLCILLVKNLQISLGQAFGLLIDRSKYLKKLVVQGSKKDEFQSLKKFYEQITDVWPLLEQFLNSSPKDTDKILQGLAQGVLSQNMDIIHSTLNLLSFAKQQQWFIKYGYYKLLSSSYIQCFYFTIQRLSPKYQSILNDKLHTQMTDKIQLFTILNNLVKILPKTIYCKQILMHIPINYFYEQCYSVLNLDDIDDQKPEVIIRAKQLLARLMIYFPDKIPHSYVARIVQTFKYQGNRSYTDTYHTVSLLFDILEVLMHKQSPLTEKFFKVCMKYVSSTFGQTRHWIIENLRYLYQRMTKSFPLGCMLMMYSLDPVAQPDQYQLFDIIADDNAHMNAQQATLALNYLTKYVQTQIHCKCFVNIINKFLTYHSKIAGKWGEQSCTRLLSKMQQINIPMLNHGEINVLNPKPPVKNRVINSIGMKRKEMLKFREYELAKQMLQILLNVKDKNFLNYYVDSLTHTIATIQKQIGHNKKQLVTLFKKLRATAKKRSEQILQSPPMAEMVKSIIQSRSAMRQTFKTQAHNIHSPNTYSVIQSQKWDSQSRVLPQPHQKQLIIQQQQQNEQNQFINQSYMHNEVSKDQSLNNSSQILPQMMLLPFSDEDRLQQHTMFYGNNMLEQNQILYINMLKHKYQYIFTYCTHYLEKLLATTSDIDYVLREFMRELGLSRIIDAHQVQEIYLKCKILSNNNHQIVQNLLIQIAFRAFDFKKDRRISVLCLSSLFVLIEQNIKNKLQHHKKKNQKQLQITKNVQFQFKLCNTVYASNSQSKSYFDCFAILNDILKKGLGFNLMQPLSKIVNQFAIPGSKQQLQRKSFYEDKQDGSQLLDQKDKTQLDLLEQQLQAQNLIQSQLFLVQKNEQKQQAKYRLRKAKKRAVTQQSRQQSQIISPKMVDNKQLRNKLSLRLKMMQGQMKKKQKVSKKLFTQPTQEQPKDGDAQL